MLATIEYRYIGRPGPNYSGRPLDDGGYTEWLTIGPLREATHITFPLANQPNYSAVQIRVRRED